MSRSDGIDELDPRFPIALGPRCDVFWAALAPWQAHPPRHPARTFAIEEAAAAVEQNTRQETTFIQPLPGTAADRLVWALPLGTPDDDDTPFVQVPWSRLVEDPSGALRAPVPYPPLAEDTLAHEFTLTGPLDMLP